MHEFIVKFMVSALTMVAEADDPPTTAADSLPTAPCPAPESDEMCRDELIRCLFRVGWEGDEADLCLVNARTCKRTGLRPSRIEVHLEHREPHEALVELPGV